MRYRETPARTLQSVNRMRLSSENSDAGYIFLTFRENRVSRHFPRVRAIFYSSNYSYDNFEKYSISLCISLAIFRTVFQLQIGSFNIPFDSNRRRVIGVKLFST